MLTFYYRSKRKVGIPDGVVVIRAQDIDRAMIEVAVTLKEAGNPQEVQRQDIKQLPVGSFAVLVNT